MIKRHWSDCTRKIMIESMTKLSDAYKDFVEKSLIANGIDQLNAKLIAGEIVALDEDFGDIPGRVYTMAEEVVLCAWNDGYIRFTPTIKAGVEADENDEEPE